MSLDPIQKLASTLATTANEQDSIKQNLSPDDSNALLQVQFSEGVVADGTLGLTAIKHTYKSDSFIIDHPTQGLLDSRYFDYVGIPYSDCVLYLPTNENPTAGVVEDKSAEGNNGTFKIDTAAYWSLNNTLEDHSNNGNDAIVSGDLYPDMLWMKFDGDATDSSSYALSPSSSGLTYTAGLFGEQCAVFDGSATANVTYTGPSSNQLSATIEMWVNPTSLSSEGFIWSFNGCTGCSIGTDGKINVYLRETALTNGHRKITGTTVLSTGSWYHVIVKLTGRGSTNQSRAEYEAKIFVNLVRETISTQSTSTGASTTSGQLNIGCETTSTNKFVGLIQDVRVYAGFTETSEDAEIYNSGAGSPNQIGLSLYADSFISGVQVRRQWGHIGGVTLASSTPPAELYYDYTDDFVQGIWFKPIMSSGAGATPLMGRNFQNAIYFTQGTIDTSINVQARVRTGSTTQGPGQTVNINQWHGCLARYQASSRKLFFDINGTIDSTGTTTTVDFLCNATFYAGIGSIAGGNTTYYSGYYCQVFVDTRFYSAQESTNWYNITSQHLLNQPLVSYTDANARTIEGLEFDGKTTYLELDSVKTLDKDASAVYVEFVSKALNSSYTNRSGVLFSQNNTTGPYNDILTLQGTGYPMTLEGETDSNGEYFLQDVSSISQNIVYRLLIVYDSGTAYTYLDNTLIDTRAVSFDTSFGIIGRALSGSDIAGLTGIISKPIIFNRVLTSDERTAIFSDNMNVVPDLSVGWLELDGGYEPNAATFPLTFPIILGEGEELFNIDI